MDYTEYRRRNRRLYPAVAGHRIFPVEIRSHVAEVDLGAAPFASKDRRAAALPGADERNRTTFAAHEAASSAAQIRIPNEKRENRYMHPPAAFERIIAEPHCATYPKACPRPVVSAHILPKRRVKSMAEAVLTAGSDPARMGFEMSMKCAIRLILVLAVIAFSPPFAASALDLPTGSSDLSMAPKIRINARDDRGYDLYVPAKPGMASILLTETRRSRDEGRQLRLSGHGAERRQRRRNAPSQASPSRPRANSIRSYRRRPCPCHFGTAFRILIPPVLIYGYPWSRSGTVAVGQGTYLNIRAFAKRYADYSAPSWIIRTRSRYPPSRFRRSRSRRLSLRRRRFRRRSPPRPLLRTTVRPRKSSGLSIRARRASTSSCAWTRPRAWCRISKTSGKTSDPCCASASRASPVSASASCFIRTIGPTST